MFSKPDNDSNISYHESSNQSDEDDSKSNVEVSGQSEQDPNTKEEDMSVYQSFLSKFNYIHIIYI